MWVVNAAVTVSAATAAAAALLCRGRRPRHLKPAVMSVAGVVSVVLAFRMPIAVMVVASAVVLASGPARTGFVAVVPFACSTAAIATSPYEMVSDIFVLAGSIALVAIVLRDLLAGSATSCAMSGRDAVGQG